MKTPLLLLCTLTISLLSAQSSDWLPKDAVLYYKYQSFGFPALIEIYEITVEEAISTDTSEIRILSESCNNCGGIDFDAGYFERVSQKLWYVTNLDSTRYLLYDFGAQVGDTVTYLGRLDPIEYGYYVVHSIDTIDFLDTMIAAHSIQSHQEWEYGWIIYEGIGSGGYFVPQYGLADPGIGPLIGYWHPTKGYHCFVSPFCALPLTNFDYAPFPEIKDKLFQLSDNQEDDIYGVSIDSVYANGDTLILIPNIGVTDSLDYLDPKTSSCYSTHGGWMFHHLELYPDGKIIFNTGELWQHYAISGGDEVLIDTRANLGDSWIAMQAYNVQDGDTLVVWATVTAHLEEEVLGVLDSVKTITFSAEGTDHYDQFFLKLGKSTGLVSAINFRQFSRLEDFHIINSYDDFGNFPLAANVNTGKDVRNLTWLDVWSFNLGDMIHSTDYMNPVDSGDSRSEQRAWHVLDRNHQIFNVTYLIDEQIRVLIGDSIASYTRDTIELTFVPDQEFDQLPGTFVYDNSMHAYYRQGWWMGRETKCMNGGAAFHITPSCTWHIYSEECTPCPLYIRGLGGGYYACWDLEGNFYRNSIAYFRKDTVEWGTPFDFTVSINDIAKAGDFNIYPNPVSDKIFIETSEPVTHVRILTPAGMIVIEGQIYQDKILDAGDLPPGLYFIQVYNERERIASQKIIMN